MNFQVVRNPDTDPIYDVDTLDEIKEQETEQLIQGLAEYARSLEMQVVSLRTQVNKMTPPGQEEPFQGVHSDLYERFDHYEAYPKYEHIFKIFE